MDKDNKMWELNQIEIGLSELEDIREKAFSLPTVEEYMDECERIWKLKKPLLFKKYQMTEIVFDNPIPEYGDLMPLEDFLSCCRSGGFIDSDGSGTYANATHESNIPAIPSMMRGGMILNNPELTHVVWYNK